MEFYAFVHFTINTFTDKEWGFGDEPPKLFNPVAFDAEQIAVTCKNAGMKGIVLTAKHHDGFCLWPTKTTAHNISKSPFRDGKGDLVQEIVDACRKHGLKVGMYLSPWDRNHPEYGSPGYVEVFRSQLSELLTNYGEVFEVWFDGANGGTGYYGGANEERIIDRTTYYSWGQIFKLVRELQPTATIFSDLGPDIRWLGNEEGLSGDPCWHRYTPMGREEGVPPAIGQTKYREGVNGHREGRYWMPTESDTSIRPGWFYHASEDGRVKSGEELVELYYNSVGHGTTLNLNIPPDGRGQVHENDIASLTRFREIIDATFANDLTKGAIFSASNTRDESEKYGVQNLRDQDQQSFWATDDEALTPNLVIDFQKVVEFNVVNIREFIPLGQRIWGWALDRWEGGKWLEFTNAESIGHRRLWKGSLQTTSKIRFRVAGLACPILTEFSVHLQPISLSPPMIARSKSGSVSISGFGVLRYTLDGSRPNEQSQMYKGPIELKSGGTVSAKAYYKGESGPITAAVYTQSREKWKVMSASSFERHNMPWKAFDENSTTDWHTEKDDTKREISIDLGEILELSAFTMLPGQDGIKVGIITNYTFYTILDGESWKNISSGEFSNIFNNPIEQVIQIDPIKAKFIKLKANKVIGDEHAVIAELGVIVK